MTFLKIGRGDVFFDVKHTTDCGNPLPWKIAKKQYVFEYITKSRNRVKCVRDGLKKKSNPFRQSKIVIDLFDRRLTSVSCRPVYFHRSLGKITSSTSTRSNRHIEFVRYVHSTFLNINLPFLPSFKRHDLNYYRVLVEIFYKINPDS